MTAPVGLPRLLAAQRDGGPLSLAEHVAVYGPLPRAGRSRERRGALIAAVERSGLRGRGGAGFPTATKLRAVAQGDGERVVVVNAAEGEPASLKDKLLLSQLPHLVLDGAFVAAEIVDADEVIVAVERSAPVALRSAERAVEEWSAVQADLPPVRIVSVPSRYVAGEESALVHFLNGGDAKPTFVPPRPFESGVRGRPTLVQNAETLANLALIARFGDEWFRSLGSPDEPGSALVTVGGAVAHPGVFEIALGSPISTVIEAAGGRRDDIAAILVGGYFGSWISTADGWGLGLAHNELRAARSTFGCGVVFALPKTSCPVVETARVARYLAQETAGQCGPCVKGLDAIAGALEQIANGRPRKTTLDDLARWTGQVANRGACHLPDGAVRFVATALAVFSDHVNDHLTGHRCDRARNPAALPLPAKPERGWR